MDAVDESGNTVVAIIKPTDKAFNVIPSVYGKKEIENLIRSSDVRYVNDIEIPATASIDLASLRLRGGDSARGNNISILKKSDIVNTNYQNGEPVQKSRLLYPVMGQYEPLTKVITLFKGRDKTTFTHEMLHHYLPIYLGLLERGGKWEKLQGLYKELGVSRMVIIRRRMKPAKAYLNMPSNG